MFSTRHVFAIAGMLLVWMTSEPVWAQRLFPPRADDVNMEAILLAPRSLVRLLREGAQALQEKRYTDGIGALSALLLEEPRDDVPEDELSQDFFLEPTGRGYYSKSVRGEALWLLSTLPEEGRKTLEIQLGLSARKALEKAVANRDFGAIGEVARKYYYTDAGYDATILLAQAKLIQGYPLTAGNLLHRLYQYPAARARYGAALAGELATAWYAAGRADLAGNALERAAGDFPNEPQVRVGQREFALAKGSDWKSILQSGFRRESESADRPRNDWMLTGGAPDRNSTASAGLPLPSARWHKTLHRDQGDEKNVQEISERESQNNRVLIPKMEARTVGDLVLAKRTNSVVYALDLNNGLIKWLVQAHGAPSDVTPMQPSIPVSDEDSVAVEELKKKVWGSTSFGQFTCDHAQIYTIFAIEEQPVAPTIQRNGMLRIGARENLTNYLAAWSISGEGKKLWQVGGASGDMEPKLAGAYFLGAPLAYEGQLYLLAEINAQTSLVVLDSRTGALQWTQQLVQHPIRSIDRDPARQAQGLSPSISDSVIVCPCGNGMVVAVDALTRSLMWAFQYHNIAAEQGPINQFNNLQEFSDNFDPTAEHWQDPIAAIHNGTVVLTPGEAELLLCLDLMTGKPRWPQQSRGSGRYIAGLIDDRLIIVGNRHLYALSLQNGHSVWEADINLPDRQSVAGKGIRDGKYYYLPTSGRQVLKIDLHSGKIVESAQVDRALGNLFGFQNQVVSVGPTELAVYYTRDALSIEVEKRLAQNPLDVWGLNQQGQLFMAQGKIGEAVAILRRSLSIDPKDVDTRYLLVDALLTGLEKDFDTYLPMATELESIIEVQRFRFLSILVQGNLRARQFAEAFPRLLQLMQDRLAPRASAMQLRSEMIRIADNHEVDIDQWIASQLAFAYRSATPAEQTQMQSLVERQIQGLPKHHPFIRQLQLQYLAWLPDAHAAILDSAKPLRGRADQTVAERLMIPVLMSGTEDLRDQARVALMLPTLADREIFGPRGILEVRFDADSPALIDGLGNIKQPDDSSPIVWPNGMVDPTVSLERRINFAKTRVKQTSERFGRPDVIVGVSHDELTISNSLGYDVRRFPFRRGIFEGVDNLCRAQIVGGLILLETQSELMAFDLYRGLESPLDSMLWRHSLLSVAAGPATPFRNTNQHPTRSLLGFTLYSRGANRESVVGPVTPAGVIIQQGSELTMLHPLTGTVVWTRSGYSLSTSLTASDLEISVLDPNAMRIDVLDCRDGTLIRNLPYEGDWNTWFACGRKIVQYAARESTTPAKGIQSDDASQTAIRIVDSANGATILEKVFPTGSRADWTNDRFVIVAQPNAETWFCDVQTGLQKSFAIKYPLSPESIRIQEFGDKLVVLSNCGHNPPIGVNVFPKSEEMSVDRGVFAVNGPVFALSVQSGELLWERPAAISHFRFSSSQPRSTPYLVLHRFLGQNSNSKLHGGLAVIDMRDGRLVYSTNELHSATVASASLEAFNVTVDGVEPGLRVFIGEYLVSLKMTDEERPPQPIANFGYITPMSGRSSLRSEHPLQDFPAPFRQ